MIEAATPFGYGLEPPFLVGKLPGASPDLVERTR
jgi:hypothetical protein